MSRFAGILRLQDPGMHRSPEYFGMRAEVSTGAARERNRNALSDMVGSIVDSSSSWTSDTSRLEGACSFLFRRGRYTISSGDPITIPGDIGLEIVAEAKHAATIELEGGGDVFQVSSGWAPTVFRGVIFDGCGVLIDGGARGGTDFDACYFDSTDNYAIRTGGSSVVNARISNCRFNRCYGGIGVLDNACDNWVIDDCRFVRMEREGVVIKSSGVILRDSNFENKLDADARAYPHVTVEPNGESYDGGIVRLLGNRFGPETGTGAGPPEYNVRLGPSEATTGTMTGITLRDNHHHRRNGGPLAAGASPGSSIAGVYLTKDVRASVIDDWFQADTYTFGTALVLNASSGGSPADNVLNARVVSANISGITTFSGTSTGWTVSP